MLYRAGSDAPIPRTRKRKGAFRRWVAVGGLVTSLGLISACAKPRPAAPEAIAPAVTFNDPPHRAGQDTITILIPARPTSKELWSELVVELSEEFDIVTVPVDLQTRVTHLAQKLDQTQPVCVVVVDNRTLKLYRELQRLQPQREFPPVVVLMTSFLDQVIGTVRSSTGIAYEVPAVSSFVALRQVSLREINTVGVLHREMFGSLVAAQTQLASVEKLTLVGQVVSNRPKPKEVEEALLTLIEDQHVDALWVLNDNGLLTRELIADSWLPILEEYPLPVVVGVSALVRADVHFGALAVLPDHRELGVQAANMIFDLANQGWKLDNNRVELPIGLKTVVDVAYVRDNFGLRPGALERIDRAIQ